MSNDISNWCRKNRFILPHMTQSILFACQKLISAARPLFLFSICEFFWIVSGIRLLLIVCMCYIYVWSRLYVSLLFIYFCIVLFDLHLFSSSIIVSYLHHFTIYSFTPTLIFSNLNLLSTFHYTFFVPPHPQFFFAHYCPFSLPLLLSISFDFSSLIFTIIKQAVFSVMGLFSDFIPVKACMIGSFLLSLQILFTGLLVDLSFSKIKKEMSIFYWVRKIISSFIFNSFPLKLLYCFRSPNSFI